MFRVFLVIALLVSLSACGNSGAENTLTIFAAASLTEAFSELVSVFEISHPEVDVMLSFAGSNTLRAQIEQGAQADVFASANTQEMDSLAQIGLVNMDGIHIFSSNKLVIVTPENNPAEITTFEDLAHPDLKLVLAAEEVPVGRYARLMLDNAGQEFKTQVLENVVSNESTVKQVLAKVQLGEADAGIVYASDAASAPDLPVIDIPPEMNVLAEYPIATLRDTPNPELADAFVDFVLSTEGQPILQKWGFKPVD